MASVIDLLRKHKGDENYHPLCSLLDLADDVTASVGDKINIHKSIAKYCEAERKAIEIDSTRDEPINLRFLIS